MPKFPKCHVVVDGSNVVARPNGVPSLNRLLIVRDALKKRGCESIDLIVDPTLKTTERLADGDRTRLKDMIRNNEIIEAPSEADPWIINRAKNRDGFVVSNDQFRDHGHQWPILPARLIGFMFAETGCTFQTAQKEILDVSTGEDRSFVAEPPLPPVRQPAPEVKVKYSYTRLDDLVALYLLKCDPPSLAEACRRIASDLGMKPGSLKNRVSNFEYIKWRGRWEPQKLRPKGPGFKNYAKQSWQVYAESGHKPCAELKQDILHQRPGLSL